MDIKMFILQRLLVAFGLLLPTLTVSAATPKQYCIASLNCKYSLIGNKKLRQGDVFCDTLTIYWADTRQQLSVVEVGDKHGHIKHLTKEKFDHYKQVGVRSLSDYIIQERRLGTRDFRPDVRPIADSVYAMADTLYLPAVSVPDDRMRTEIVWKYHTRVLTLPVARNSDGRFFVVPRPAFAGRKLRTASLTIHERSMANPGWDNVIYRNLKVICLPISDK